jgi:hypothetical protein
VSFSKCPFYFDDGVKMGHCGGLFCRRSEMRGPLAQQRGLAEASRGGDEHQLARHTLIQLRTEFQPFTCDRNPARYPDHSDLF